MTKVPIDDTLTITVSFDIADRAEGYEDDIRLALQQFGASETWLFPANEISVLLTVEQAEQLAAGLLQAAAASRSDPRPGVPLDLLEP